MGVSAGRVLLIPKGDWNAEITYTGLDWVRHNGAAWVCKNTCTNVEPTEANSDNWQIIARDGQSGSVINVDVAMSDTSENPVQNKVIKKYVDDHTPEVADMTGATATQNGAHGLVPAPQIGDEKKALLGNGTWGSVDAILTYKTKEEYDTAVANDEIPDGAKVIKEYDEEGQSSVIDIDTAMSDTSVNPVQNKVVKKYIDELKEIELTKHNIEGIDASRVQCFVKNNVAYVNGTIIYEPNAGVMDAGEFLAIENLPIPAYNSDLLVYMQYFGTDASASGVECAINKNGQLHIYGTAVPTGVSIVIIVSYPIA